MLSVRWVRRGQRVQWVQRVRWVRWVQRVHGCTMGAMRCDGCDECNGCRWVRWVHECNGCDRCDNVLGLDGASFFSSRSRSDVPPPRVVRIIEEQRGAYRVAGDVDGWAEVSGKFRHDARATAEFPAVGDWVCIAPQACRAEAMRVAARRRADVRSSRAASIAAARFPARPPVAPSKSRCGRERRHDLSRHRARRGSEPTPPRALSHRRPRRGRGSRGRAQQDRPQRRSGRTGSQRPRAPAVRRRPGNQREAGRRPRRA